MNIIEAIHDPKLFRPFLAPPTGLLARLARSFLGPRDDLASWSGWMTALRVLYGLPIEEAEHDLIRACTGRDPTKLPADGFKTALFLTGRRSGKSRIAAVIGAFEAALTGREKDLAKGEQGIVPIISPTRRQSQIVRSAVGGAFDSPILRHEVADDLAEVVALRNGIRLEILAGDHRAVRGFSCLAAIVDEVCFFGLDAEARTKSDSELIRAIRPSLATTGGRLIAISTPYAKRGWAYSTWQTNFGNDRGSVLVWQAASRVMNPTLPQEIVDEAMAEDMAAALAEYKAEFRDDVSSFVGRDVVQACVIPGRKALPPVRGVAYRAFADMSGGRGDDAALAIAHRSGKCVLDLLRRWRPPFDPKVVVREMAADLKAYGLAAATGDHYGADWVVSAFREVGIHFINSELPKSALYLEFLPRLTGREAELLDDEILVNQLALLERRVRSGGRDGVDHPPGGHDDLANVVAGVAVGLMTGFAWPTDGSNPFGVGRSALRSLPRDVFGSGGDDAARQERQKYFGPGANDADDFTWKEADHMDHMPFGGHEGKLLSDLPPPYLLWLMRNRAGLDAALAEAVEAEFRRRKLSSKRPRWAAGGNDGASACRNGGS